MEGFWSEEEGAVLSCSINKYIYIIVLESADKRIHVKYYDHEDVDDAEDIKHDLVRESLKKAGIKGGIEIFILSDIPHTGSGLGSSSSLTVGLLNAFYGYVGKEISPEILAREACDIEINILGKVIGRQDQYIAAYGGLNVIRFYPDGEVEVRPVQPEYDVYQVLQKYLLLFYTGKGRKAEDILGEQNRKIVHTRSILRKMKEQVTSALEKIYSVNIEQLGLLISEGWMMKKQLADGICSQDIEDLVEKALNAGASGAKITGAGGGGFLLVFCHPDSQYLVRNTLKNLTELKIDLERNGTQVFSYNHKMEHKSRH